ncbi:MAG: nitrilase family protein [Kiloniellaceae bacterium]
MGEAGNEPAAEVRVACVQMRPEVGAKAENIATSRRFIETAAAQGAKLIVLPELCNSGYVFESLEEARSLAEPVPGGPSCELWAELAARLDVYIVAGINELAETKLYNSAVVIGPQGYLATYRKVHLWDKENLFFAPGDLGFPVVETPLGRLGVFICYDTWFSECYRLCVLQGADIICLPTNWVPIVGQDPTREAMANILCMGAAHTNSVYVAAADRVGKERGQSFVGQSLIVSYTGWPIGGPASADQEEIIYADCNPAAARAARVWNDHNNILHDRRTDIYDEMLGTHVKPGSY